MDEPPDHPIGVSTFSKVLGLTSLLTLIEVIHIFDSNTYQETVEPAECSANIQARNLTRHIIHVLDQTYIVISSDGYNIRFQQWIQQYLDYTVHRIFSGSAKTVFYSEAGFSPDELMVLLLAVYKKGVDPFISTSVFKGIESYEIHKIDLPPNELAVYSKCYGMTD